MTKKATLVALDTYVAGTEHHASVGGFGRYTSFAFALRVDAKTGSGQTLDAKIEHSIDDGETWFTLEAFAQTDGATPSTDTQLITVVVGTDADVVGDLLRVTSVVSAGDSFDFLITAYATR